ncbi:hypothetical protein SAMN02745218_01139 [Desulfofundulus australicus DSM 11792]|uniref:Uncharacterized protein n=1 Tax=Desulfofundulus australicus DSM 11792 TaxID=1121425 RepID=A0A1M4XRH6_9FIRM|nr:hypothetical protein [Desulfofundulus australicus]SHE96010.1 hypothetical protein SAMN02745218_01139 [Desulfofundulus australicus DSM 11792]
MFRTRDQFLKNVSTQAEINRLAHGSARRTPQEWAMIAGTHMGHLLEAVLQDDREKIEKELLHVAAPLLELHCELQRRAVEERQLALAF